MNETQVIKLNIRKVDALLDALEPNGNYVPDHLVDAYNKIVNDYFHDSNLQNEYLVDQDAWYFDEEHSKTNIQYTTPGRFLYLARSFKAFLEVSLPEKVATPSKTMGPFLQINQNNSQSQSVEVSNEIKVEVTSLQNFLQEFEEAKKTGKKDAIVDVALKVLPTVVNTILQILKKHG